MLHVHAPGCDPSDTCVQGTWPSYMIDTKATFNRVMSWMSYHYQIEGVKHFITNGAEADFVVVFARPDADADERVRLAALGTLETLAKLRPPTAAPNAKLTLEARADATRNKSGFWLGGMFAR